jgi:hypothetical protein
MEVWEVNNDKLEVYYTEILMSTFSGTCSQELEPNGKEIDDLLIIKI